jgi:hypothetical protein
MIAGTSPASIDIYLVVGCAPASWTTVVEPIASGGFI